MRPPVELFLQPVERHVCLAGADFVAGESETEAEDFGFLFVKNKHMLALFLGRAV